MHTPTASSTQSTMSLTTKLLVLSLCLPIFLETSGNPIRSTLKPKCYPGSKIEGCDTKCDSNDHLCNINSQFPGIEIVEIKPSDPDSSVASSSSTTTRRTPTMTTTKKMEISQPEGGSSGVPCPQYPILQPSGSKNPNCSIPISQYGCKTKSQDPWCRFFAFMYLYGSNKGTIIM